MGRFDELLVYRQAFALAMEVFRITQKFPEEEKFGLISQIRRSSRSVCSNIAEGYRKRRYRAHFISKLTDADMENSETIVWIDFAYSCKYIGNDTHTDLIKKSEEIGRLVSYMIHHPDRFQ